MIEGGVDDRGVPVIEVALGGRNWTAMIDTGFNGYLELPEDLRPLVQPEFAGRATSLLAGGQVLTEEQFYVTFPFDGSRILALATFVSGDGILIGTKMLRPYRLTVDFPDCKVWLEQD